MKKVIALCIVSMLCLAGCSDQEKDISEVKGEIVTESSSLNDMKTSKETAVTSAKDEVQTDDGDNNIVINENSSNKKEKIDSEDKEAEETGVSEVSGNNESTSVYESVISESHLAAETEETTVTTIKLLDKDDNAVHEDEAELPFIPIN